VVNTIGSSRTGRAIQGIVTACTPSRNTSALQSGHFSWLMVCSHRCASLSQKSNPFCGRDACLVCAVFWWEAVRLRSLSLKCRWRKWWLRSGNSWQGEMVESRSGLGNGSWAEGWVRMVAGCQWRCTELRDVRLRLKEIWKWGRPGAREKWFNWGLFWLYFQRGWIHLGWTVRQKLTLLSHHDSCSSGCSVLVLSQSPVCKEECMELTCRNPSSLQAVLQSHSSALSTVCMCCALRAELCCKFSVASSVCVSWNENAEERACDLALMWALGSLHLQANFTEILCKWHRFYWTLRSCICRRMSLITKNAYGCLVFVLTNPIYFARAWFLTWLNVSETFLLF